VVKAAARREPADAAQVGQAEVTGK
jgi:hypothetical protein